MKIVLGFLSKVFAYDQGTKPAALRWSQKAPFFLTRKNVIFWARKNSVFSHSPPEVVDNPKSTVKKTCPRRKKMINNVCQKIPQKNPFFWNCSKQKLWPGRKNTIFSHNEDSQNIVIFSASDVQKTAKIRPPPRWVRCHDKNKYPRQGNMYSERFPKKVHFFGIFRNVNYAKVNFPGYS